MLIKIKYNNPKIKKILITKNSLNLGILKRLIKGVKIIKIKPTKLLIKNRGYLNTFVQKLFII